MHDKKRSILVVDDNKNFAGILKNHIEDHDQFEIAGVAYDGREAVSMIIDKMPDIVILDIIMPRLDGIGVLEKMRELGLNDKIKFVVLSAVGQDHITSRALGLGATYYVVKPFDINVFFERLGQMTQKVRDEEGNRDQGGAEEASMEAKIIELLANIGVPPHIKGYKYIIEGVKYLSIHEFEDVKITTDLYPTIADTFGTNRTSVERAIRNAIEISLNRGNLEVMLEIFAGVSGVKKRKITNSEFLTGIFTHLKTL